MRCDGRRRAPDAVRHPGTAEARRQSRLRDPRGADGRQPLPRRRPGQHRLLLGNSDEATQRRDLRRTGRTDRTAPAQEPEQPGPAALADPGADQRRQRRQRSRPDHRRSDRHRRGAGRVRKGHRCLGPVPEDRRGRTEPLRRHRSSPPPSRSPRTRHLRRSLRIPRRSRRGAADRRRGEAERRLLHDAGRLRVPRRRQAAGDKAGKRRSARQLKSEKKHRQTARRPTRNRARKSRKPRRKPKKPKRAKARNRSKTRSAASAAAPRPRSRHERGAHRPSRSRSSAPASPASAPRSSSTRPGSATGSLLEAGDGVGGAWHWNTYPGVGVDIPSFSYQFSFEQRATGRASTPPGAELKAYAEHCVDNYGLRSRIRLNTKVVGADLRRREPPLARSTIADGEPITARFVVGATGVFTQPKPPDIPGLDDFAGTVMHTARWDHDVDLRGKRVAVIGTGASAVQVIPSIAPEVEQLTVFQRTPIWCLPKLDGAIAPRAAPLLERVPGAQRAARRASQAFVELTFPLPPTSTASSRSRTSANDGAASSCATQVQDPVVRDKLTPALRPRLQAPELLERVPAHLQPRQRPPRDDADRGDHAGRRADRRRHRARGRRPHPRDRLQGLRDGQHAAVPGARPRRRRPRRAGGTRTASRPTRASASRASPTSS